MPVLYISSVPEVWGRRTNISTEYDMCSMYEVKIVLEWNSQLSKAS